MNSFRMALAWLALTLAIYGITARVQKRTGFALVNPLLVTMLVMGGLTTVLGVPHQTYFAHVAILNYLLGAAVVALAVPLYVNLRRLRTKLWLSLAAMIAASVSSAALTLYLSTLLDLSRTMQLSLMPKHSTTAVSIEVAHAIGGLPALAAFLTVTTSIVTAVLGPWLLDVMGIRSPCARGLAYGLAGHAVGTSRAFAESEITGCWSSIAMTVNAVLTALLVPPLVAAWLAARP